MQIIKFIYVRAFDNYDKYIQDVLSLATKNFLIFLEIELYSSKRKTGKSKEGSPKATWNNMKDSKATSEGNCSWKSLGLK